MMRSRPIVIALGGNAISPEGQEGNIDQQFEQTRRSMKFVADLYMSGHRIVLTHGNGPQVGNLLHRVELARREVYDLPLYLCVADTQAGMGLMISQCLSNELATRGVERVAHTLVTRVVVDANDPAFANPTKPIGPPHDAATALKMKEEFGWDLHEVKPGVFRRTVASPPPQAIMEIDLIRRMVAQGELLVVAGGGGVPVVQRTPAGEYEGAAAVVDKDLSAALLAVQLNASSLVIVTDVEYVALNYGRPGEQHLTHLDTAQARGWLEQGQFPAGSMGPKIRAAVQFLEQATGPQCVALITDIEHMQEALAGRGGTQINRAAQDA